MLRHWAKYFSGVLGVTEFFLTTFGSQEDQERASLILSRVGSVTLGKIFPANLFSMHRRERYVRQIHEQSGKQQWAFFCDLDEFPYMPLGISHYLKQAESFDCPFVAGRWVDRLSPDGSLIRVDERPLEQQFPLALRYKRSMHNSTQNRGDFVFVLSKTGLTSHHPQEHRPFSSFEGVAPQVDVHHFKWHAKLRERLTQRKAVRGKLIGYQQHILDTLELDGSIPAASAIHVGSLLGC